MGFLKRLNSFETEAYQQMACKPVLAPKYFTLSLNEQSAFISVCQAITTTPYHLTSRLIISFVTKLKFLLSV